MLSLPVHETQLSKLTTMFLRIVNVWIGKNYIRMSLSLSIKEESIQTLITYTD